MKKTFVGVLAVSALLLAGCGSNDSEKAEEPLTGDPLFLSSLESQGLTGEYDDETAISLAQTFCESGTNGMSPVVSIVKGNKNFAYPGKEREFVEASFEAYCPDQLNASAPSTSATATTTLRRGELLPEDRAFLASLDSFWTDGAPRADLIEVGNSLCDKFRSGADKMDILQAVLPDSGPADKNINLLYSATLAYCPEYLTGIK